MVENVFPYSGGKSNLVDWITNYFPNHRVYVEPFGGSASVLVNKPPSQIEVYNDLDSRLVNFFEVFRDETDELVEWLNRTPYSRELHDRYTDIYFNGDEEDMPDDPVERAGIFFYLRYTQLMAKTNSKSAFQSTVDRNNAVTFRNATERLERLVSRFEDVIVENRDYQRIFDHYDAEDAFFYCDPPYLKKGTTWYEGEFDHEEFWETVGDAEGDVMVSYMAIPDYVPIEDYYVLEREFSQSQNTAHDDEDRTERRVEKLILNYDPDQVRGFKTANHSSAVDW